MNAPCEHCPWRLANQGKRTPWGFYTRANLRRLWNQIRKADGAAAQSCHPTDPSHPDHIAAGAKADATPRECPGSVILVVREFHKLAALGGGTITPEACTAYFRQHPRGLSKRGVLHWLVGRHQLGGTLLGSGPKLPAVDVDDPAIGLPPELA